MLYLALVATLHFAPMPATAETITAMASVIDGDTLGVRGRRICLHGNDAPKSRQRCIRADGTSWRCRRQAALALSDLIGRQQISCVRDKDRYSRAITVCVQDGSDLNAWMVQQGWALADRRYSRGYTAAEEDVHLSRRNIWSGQFDGPWDWPRAQRGG